MALYFSQKNDLTWERILIDSVNACLMKQKSSRIKIPQELMDSNFRMFLGQIIDDLKVHSLEKTLVNMKRTKVTLSPNQKRLAIELTIFARTHWKNIKNAKFENTHVAFNLLKNVVSKNTEFITKLREYKKESIEIFLTHLDSSKYTELANSLYLAAKTPFNPSWDRAPFLPPSKKNNLPLLILDIDETLVHTFLKEPAQFTFRKVVKYSAPVLREKKIQNESFEQIVWVKTRPHLQTFLESLSEHFEIVTWTASIQNYADIVVDQIDPEKNIISHRLCRQHCTCNPGNEYVKDLDRLGRDLSRCIIIDNSCLAFAFQLSNGIPIFPFCGDKEDSELLHLIPILVKLSKQDDVRPMLKDIYKLEKIKNQILVSEN